MGELADRCRDRWPSIFLALGFGFSEKLLRHKNVPCPMCGGRDRFQFSDRSWGRWHCRHCNGGEGGDGIRLVERMLGVNFREAARRIEEVIGSGPAPVVPRATLVPRVVDFPRAESKTDDDKPLRPWREAVPLDTPDGGRTVSRQPRAGAD
jgi:putative DNA primase/helicase